MRNAGLAEAQAGIKIAGRNINILKYMEYTYYIYIAYSIYINDVYVNHGIYTRRMILASYV